MGPVIGILTTSESGDCPTFEQRSNTSQGHGCFTAFYVKWVEMAGGRVVPIYYDSTQSELDSAFDHVNGILFTGGGLDLVPTNAYYKTALYLFQKVVKANDDGDKVPLWGTCMGSQLLAILAAADSSVLTTNAFDSENLALALDYTEQASSSRLMNPSQREVQWMGKENITANLHHDGLEPRVWNNNTKLTSFYRILSTNRDRKGREFISSYEAIDYPIYAVQFHPERPTFEWSVEQDLSHSSHAIKSSQYMADFFIDEARKNTHQFPSLQQQNQELIYNYKPIYTGSKGYEYYVF